MAFKRKVKGTRDESNDKRSSSAIVRVLKEKNKLTNKARNKRQDRLADMRIDSIYRAKLVIGMDEVDKILNDNDIQSVVISVDNKNINRFMSAIYRQEMAAYDITQLKEDEFRVERKQIYL